ncbi:TetR/AcrR family transcriptional regulator [Streptomyces toxytricini]|uniref:TetR/AcrR family transcriptional regulator n=1 Tax=Streptomyces toxytricini TaxID=67369 RepID=UPI003448B1A8
MPKRVDHEERRSQIAEALIQVAAARGLHAVGLRDVAAEAGVSLRLVQYYFETKEKLLLHGLQHLVDGFTARVAAGISAAGTNPCPRAVIEALLLAALPADEESRAFHLLHTSYTLLAVTDPALAAQPPFTNARAAEDAVTALLRKAVEAGQASPGTDPGAEAAALLAMSAGLGTSVLAGYRTTESAAAVLRHQLDRIFATGD